MVLARWMRLCCGHRRALLRSLFARIIYGVCCARSRPVCVVINTLYVLRCACPCLMAFLGHSGPILRVLVRDISICNTAKSLHPESHRQGPYSRECSYGFLRLKPKFLTRFSGGPRNGLNRRSGIS